MQGATSGQAFTDCFDGGRYCVRHCTLVNGHLDSHEGGSRFRATRQIEVYANTCTADDGIGTIIYARGGSVIVFSNITTGYIIGGILANYRSFVPFAPWGGMSGTNIWDNNAPSASYSGTYTGNNGNYTTMTDTNANWTPNQWVGYQILNYGAGMTFNGGGQMFGEITANTSNTITFNLCNNGAPPYLNWTNGNPYSIYYVSNGLDMCGMGKGDYISGANPTPVGWPHQQLEPCYAWGNTPSLSMYAQSVLKANVHYFNNTAKPGYVPLVYPHPLIGSVATTNQFPLVLPPSNVRAFPAYAGR
jgi:hypothetical protein